ncbi:hypothetical protein IBX73_04890 [candidate division WOR-3 bacterium]|nr:hypothetical protein [candidate division WOR-3 bacterium]
MRYRNPGIILQNEDQTPCENIEVERYSSSDPYIHPKRVRLNGRRGDVFQYTSLFLGVFFGMCLAYGQNEPKQNSVLFVEDNAGYGTAAHPDSLWYTFLTNLYGIGNFGWFGPTSDKLQNGPSLTTMQAYELVIWNNYDHYGQPLPLAPTLTATDQVNITDYINSGGKFWLIAQDALYSGVPLVFFQNNFNLDNYSPDIISVASTHIQGSAEAAGPEFLVTADYVTTIVFYPDDLIPGAGAHYIIKDTDYNFYPGIVNNDSTASFWTIDGRRPVLASTWEQLVMDMLSLFAAAPGVAEHTIAEPARHIWLTISPNVFKEHTIIRYSIPDAGTVSLTIYDKTGSLVARLSDCRRDRGTYESRWQGIDESGDKLTSGVYFLRLCCGINAITTKVSIIE